MISHYTRLYNLLNRQNYNTAPHKRHETSWKNLWGLIFILIFAAGCTGDHDHDHDDHHEGEEAHEEGGHAAHGIELHAHQIEEFGIEFETIAPATFNDVIKTSGTIEASASDVFTATAKKSGVITLAPGISEGVHVKSGERIGTITSEGIEGGDVSQAAIANMEAAKAEYERLKPLFEDKLVTASAFREAERAYKEAQALAGKSGGGGSAVVVSPGEGSVLNLQVKSGEYVNAGTPVALIGKNSTQILKADLPAREAVHLPEIECANIVPESSGEVICIKDLDGKRISGNTSAGISNGYVPVYFSFSGNYITTTAGYAEVYLICGDRQNVISVPKDALVEIQGNKYVYVQEDESFEKRLVKTGATDGVRVEITGGLNPGEKIVSKGASIVRMAEISAVAPPAHTHNH